MYIRHTVRPYWHWKLYSCGFDYDTKGYRFDGRTIYLSIPTVKALCTTRLCFPCHRFSIYFCCQVELFITVQRCKLKIHRPKKGKGACNSHNCIWILSHREAIRVWSENFEIRSGKAINHMCWPPFIKSKETIIERSCCRVTTCYDDRLNWEF